MRVSRNHSLALVAVLVLTALCAACNSSTDDPQTSESQISIAAVSPSTACVDSDGTPQGSPPVNVIIGTEQSFTFQSRVRGTSPGAVWNDAILTSVDVSYTMDSLGPTPPSRTDPVNIVIKANGTGTQSLTTVPAADIVAYLSDPGRLGKVTLQFRGRDAGGEPITLTAIEVPLQTVTVCGAPAGGS